MPARYETIARMVLQNAWTTGAEVGVLDGATHLHLLEQCPNLTLVGVDAWGMPGFAEGSDRSGEKCRCRYCEETRSRRRTLRGPADQEARCRRSAQQFGRRSILIKSASVDAAEQFEDGYFDFVFLDGDHSTSGVLGDLQAWMRKVRQGGTVIGHDWNMASVREAMRRFPLPEVLLYDDHLWAVQC